MKSFVLWFFLLASPAFASPQDVCGSFADLQKAHKFVKLTTDQFQFARGLFYEAPNTPPKLPPGDSAYIAKVDEESYALVFVDGIFACDLVVVPKYAYDIMVKVGKGEIEHHLGKT